MVRNSGVTKARLRRSWPGTIGLPPQDGTRRATGVPACGGPKGRGAKRREDRPGGCHAPVPLQDPQHPGPARAKRLSARALNVLKELAAELAGEQPPKGEWTPSPRLLAQLTAERLATARNCGPRTSREIIEWAQAHGTSIQPSFRAGRSLSQMWAVLIASASVGTLTTAEVAGALQTSIRRKSMRIPVAFQIILLELLSSM